jgi:drug/metabolite transporter (DMT)-like permease
MYGFLLAFAAAVLFAVSTPASEQLLRVLEPLQLAGLLYLGAAAAMGPVVASERKRFERVRLDPRNRLRLAGVVILGGVVAPILLLSAFRFTTAASIALLLNLEIVATALLGAFVFREHLGRGAWLGIAGVLAASVVISGADGTSGTVATLLVAGACICWGLDNHFSALIDGMTPARSTFWKGLLAGGTNVALGFALSPATPTAKTVMAALAVGAIAYGASIALHTAAAQRIGAVRAQAVFAGAPFIGAALAVVFLDEQLAPPQLAAAGLFLVSVTILIAGRHAHPHRHEAVAHIHEHSHADGHHQHEHAGGADVRHSHWHEHEPVVHAHPHWPDLHHRHSH